MDTPTLIILGVTALVLLIALWRPGAKRQPRCGPPFVRRDALLTPGELRFYRVLVRAVPTGMAVFLKVRLMDLLSVPDSAWHEYGAPASGMHVDFVLAAAGTLAPVLVIELDDKSHARPDVRKRDQFKDAAFASAGLPILRVRAAGRYDEAELRGRIAAARP